MAIYVNRYRPDVSARLWRQQREADLIQQGFSPEQAEEIVYREQGCEGSEERRYDAHSWR